MLSRCSNKTSPWPNLLLAYESHHLCKDSAALLKPLDRSSRQIYICCWPSAPKLSFSRDIRSPLCVGRGTRLFFGMTSLRWQVGRGPTLRHSKVGPRPTPPFSDLSRTSKSHGTGSCLRAPPPRTCINMD